MNIDRSVAEVQSRACKDGLGFLATVGSTSPFIGLFGTVWGILPSAHRHRRGRSGFDRQGGRPGG